MKSKILVLIASRYIYKPPADHLMRTISGKTSVQLSAKRLEVYEDKSYNLKEWEYEKIYDSCPDKCRLTLKKEWIADFSREYQETIWKTEIRDIGWQSRNPAFFDNYKSIMQADIDSLLVHGAWQ